MKMQGRWHFVKWGYGSLLVDAWVPCIPPNATKQAARVVRLRNGQRICFQPKRVKDAESSLLSLLSAHAPETPIDVPCSVMLELVYPWRKTEPHKETCKGFKWRHVRPDLGNLEKLVIDAIAPRFFVDDALIVESRNRKLWGSEPGIHLAIWAIKEF